MAFLPPKRRWGAILTAAVLGFSLVYGCAASLPTKYAQWDVDGNLIAETYDSADAVAAAPAGRCLLPDRCLRRAQQSGAVVRPQLPAVFQLDRSPEHHGVLPAVGVKRDVNSKPDAANYALRGLLSVRYTLTARDKVSDWEKQALSLDKIRRDRCLSDL